MPAERRELTAAQEIFVRVIADAIAADLLDEAVTTAGRKELSAGGTLPSLTDVVPVVATKETEEVRCR